MWFPERMDPIVLDCSRVGSLPEFWTRCQAALESLLITNVEALAATLRTMPSATSPRWLEVHCVEVPGALWHVNLVKALEELSKVLEREQAPGRLCVIRHGAPPRGRLYKHAFFRSSDLRENTIEAASYHRRARGSDDLCSMLWIKPLGRPWQRFFLDMGAVFWEEWADDATLRDFEDAGDDLRPLDEVRGLKLGDVEAARFGSAGSALRIGLGLDGVIWLLPIDPYQPLLTDSLLTIARPTADDPTG